MTMPSDEIDALGLELHTNALRSLGDIRDFLPQPSVEDVANLARYVDLHDQHPLGKQPLYQECRSALEAIIAWAVVMKNEDILSLRRTSRFVGEVYAIYGHNLEKTGSIIGLTKP